MEKRFNFCVSKNTLCRQKLKNGMQQTFLENDFSSTKFNLRLKQNKTKFATILIYLWQSKNASLTIFIYVNYKITIFFSKKKTFFLITRLFYLVQLAAKTSSNHF